MNLSMCAEIGLGYRSGAQRARVVTEAWGEGNLYCPNCDSSELVRLRNNAKASDFACSGCSFRYQLKGQRSRIGSKIVDGSFEAMMEAIRNDLAPNFFFMQYDLSTWSVVNLLLVPHFAFPASAVVKRKPLAQNARRAGWVGCNIALHLIPVEARIPVVQNMVISPANKVRASYSRLKPLGGMRVQERGWTLDVLNAVRSLGKSEFTYEDAYTLVPHLNQLHPNNHHVREKIRQRLQVLRDSGLLVHVERGRWRLP